MTFIDKNLDYFLKKDMKELNELNDWIEGRLFELMVNKFRNAAEVKKIRSSMANLIRDNPDRFPDNISFDFEEVCRDDFDINLHDLNCEASESIE